MTLLTDETAGTTPQFILRDDGAEAIPRPEYPRPDLDRSARWLTLNGKWDFESVDGTSVINVPFAWETPASGVGRTWLESATYRRSISAPSDWDGSRILLCFGAVWHRATIRIDGQLIGEHTGGYTSFEFDVTDQLHPGLTAEISVEVHAPADKRFIVHGKQRSIPRDDYDGVAFTPTSGIWQSVWLESRGRIYAQTVELRGDTRTGIDIAVSVCGDHQAGVPLSARVADGDTEAVIHLTTDEGGKATGRIELTEPRVWSPDTPHLYSVDIFTGTGDHVDQVTATTGLRTIEVRGEEIYLNDERLYIRGVLDQGYWPASGLTAPDDAALNLDLQLARDLGFNLVRKHLKFEEARWLHMADQMGVLVWAEPACPSRFSDDAATAFESQLAPMIERDGNHPAIVIWGLYNEEWGLDWDIPGSNERANAAIAAYDKLAALDHTRPIVENSGWSHVRTDLVDWHYYEPDPHTWAKNLADLASGKREDFPVRLGPNFVVDKSLYATDEYPRTGRPLLNSEFGEGFTSLERAWHVRWQTQELRRNDRFAGYVYTELTDIEHENAGLLDAHRNPKDWGGLNPADVNADTVLVLDLIPERPGADIPVPETDLTVSARISHHGQQPIAGRVRAAWVNSGTPFNARTPHRGGELNGLDIESNQVVATPFHLSETTSLTVPSPGGAARLLIWFVDEASEVIARTFIDAAEIETPNRRGARPDPSN